MNVWYLNPQRALSVWSPHAKSNIQNSRHSCRLGFPRINLNCTLASKMATERNPIRVLLPTFALAVFWGSIVVLQLCWKFVRYGPRKFFSCMPRATRPALLDDPSLGSHNFARLQVMNKRGQGTGLETGTGNCCRLMEYHEHGFTTLHSHSCHCSHRVFALISGNG